MNFYLLDDDLNYIQLIEVYTSMIWTTRYYTAGDFELYTPATEKLLNTLQRGYYIVRDDDLTQAMIISNFEVKTDVENGDYITVTGQSLKSILNRRIIWAQTVLNGNVETMARKLVTDNAINPTIAARKIPRLVLGDTIGLTGTIEAQYTGDNLGETLTAIGQTYGIGYDVLLDLENKQFKFVLLQGQNRTYNQDVNPRVVFSNEFENLLTTDYTYNSDNYKNVALVAGEGEGTARTTATIGTASGLDRYELFVDARDVSSNDGEITATEYNNLLLERGAQDLAETIITESIEGEIEPNYTYQLNRDYFLGDLVEVINTYGVSMSPRITEVIECTDTNGYTCIPTFATDEADTQPTVNAILTEDGNNIITEDGNNIITEDGKILYVGCKK